MTSDSKEQTLTGRVALVTGSARRIGRAIALELASRGAAVVVHARSDRASCEETVRLIQAAGGRARMHLADISVPEEAKRLVDFAVAEFGRLDILVNNAAVRRTVKLDQMGPTQWREAMGVVLDGAFYCAHAAYPHLGHHGVGRIINIGGVTAHVGARDRVHVVAAKAGLVGLTKALALELGPRVTVNCVAPGLIEDPADDAEATRFRRNHFPPESIPMGRTGVPQDLSGVIAALCSDQFSWVTGQTVHVNGGIFLC